MSGLVIGASGQVGCALFRLLRDRGDSPAGTCFRNPLPGLIPLDMRDEGAVSALLERAAPRTVYVPAAWTSVERCEESPEETRRTNVEALGPLAREARRIGAKLVYFSSDYVFDGTQGPYREEDAVGPINEYGRQKVEAERIVLQVPGSLVLRTTVVYGWEPRGKNFVARLLRRLRGGESIRAPEDQVGSPTYSANLAEASSELAAAGAEGVFHVAGPELMSRAGFAAEAASVFGLDAGLVEAAPTSALGQKAPRPLKAGMVVEKARALIKTRLLGCREGLRRMREEEGKA